MTMPQKPQGSVVIIGAGTQGRRLAYMWSSQGGLVYLVDLNERQLEDGLRYVQQLRTEAKHPGTWGDVRLATPDSLESILQDSWLVVEQKVLTQLDKLAPERTIIASNSSSYGIGEIIDGLALKSRQRLLSAHCYWPPETSAIEIMGHDDTDPALLSLLSDECEKHGFSPFRVRQSSIGYIYNRIWAAIKRETLLALSEGICDPQEIDAIFKDVLKTPKGPCEQMDIVGLDVVLDIEKHYAEARSGLPSEPREYLQKMIKEGSLGVKSGRGFYDYDSQAQNGH
ncbi:6-phosphogluconate dehydrogenase [Aspergillus keveii]|uniref:6-phosphogluconate dehydrogenase n=1 Tax=Aspergillus keveii TaxID=714993 RepID=A0ABR4G3W1_9EURO